MIQEKKYNDNAEETFVSESEYREFRVLSDAVLPSDEESQGC